MMLVSGKHGGFREIERRRLAADDALVDELVLRVAAAARDVAGVEHRIARLEQRHVRAGGFDDARGVIAEHFRLGFDRRLRCAHFRVDRIHRNRLDTNEKIATLRRWLCKFDVDERLRIVDRQIAGQADGFHRDLQAQTGGGLRSPNPDWCQYG